VRARETRKISSFDRAGSALAAPPALTLAIIDTGGTIRYAQDFANPCLRAAGWWALENTHWGRSPCGRLNPYLMVSRKGGAFMPIAEAIMADDAERRQEILGAMAA
jgi:hypothetical protein